VGTVQGRRGEHRGEQKESKLEGVSRTNVKGERERKKECRVKKKGWTKKVNRRGKRGTGRAGWKGSRGKSYREGGEERRE